MSKHHTDPRAEALKEGKSYTWTVPDGGNLASMRKAIKHGQTLTLSPIQDPREIQVGDFVLVKWHAGTMFHVVGEIQGDQYLIVNSLGKENGWVPAQDILGRVTKIVEPEPRPSVPVMLDRLEAAYDHLLKREQTVGDDAQRLLGVVDDLYWYADRIGAARWYEMPRSNKWSFEQNLCILSGKPKTGARPFRSTFVILSIVAKKLSVWQVRSSPCSNTMIWQKNQKVKQAINSSKSKRR